MSTKTNGPPSDADVVQAAREESAVQQRKLADARAELARLLDELHAAPPRRVPVLVYQIQRQRVVIMVLSEVINHTVDPDLHREIGVLAKMQDVGALDDADEERAEEQSRQAESVLAQRGISPETAARLARVLSTAAVGLNLTAGTAPSQEVVLEPDPDFDAGPDAD